MCTVKEIQEAIREDCKSQHDMDSTDIDRVPSRFMRKIVCRLRLSEVSRQ